MGQILVPGTAGAADVLAGKKFSAGVLYDGDGTMPNYAHATLGGGYVTALSVSSDSGGNIVMEPPTGYYTSGKNGANFGTLIANDPDFVSKNIPANKNIFGLQGAIPVRGQIVDSIQPSAKWGDGSLAAYIPTGLYTDSSGGHTGISEVKVPLSHLQAAEGNLQASNIKQGVSIFGLAGTMPTGFGSGATVPYNRLNVPIYDYYFIQSNNKTPVYTVGNEIVYKHTNNSADGVTFSKYDRSGGSFVGGANGTQIFYDYASNSQFAVYKSSNSFYLRRYNATTFGMMYEYGGFGIDFTSLSVYGDYVFLAGANKNTGVGMIIKCRISDGSTVWVKETPGFLYIYHVTADASGGAFFINISGNVGKISSDGNAIVLGPSNFTLNYNAVTNPLFVAGKFLNDGLIIDFSGGAPFVAANLGSSAARRTRDGNFVYFNGANVIKVDINGNLVENYGLAVHVVGAVVEDEPTGNLLYSILNTFDNCISIKRVIKGIQIT
ncbi:hypothetical protein [Bacillus sp. FJAT-26390]|uniref:hypothetical protein n=1 Tax=Bacillus sp. FJAT-26390 TaxID=1743142 RepID=UPI000807A3B6|nr:hypothetical protein [Bacillus sp. FJAT-26390]OBZ08591.1 hypothetical protein A7975_26275 [Bacillus sp. FJAT-26390]